MFSAPILIFIVVGIAIAVGAYYSYLAAQKRREAMASLASELGWSFDPGNDYSHDDEYAHFEVFRRGHSRYAFNTLTGSITFDGRRYAGKMGDYHYKVTSGSGKSRSTTTYQFTYVILHLPYPRVPDLLIRPEGMFDKLAGVFGFDDIDFESVEFSNRFHVKSHDKRFAYDVIDPRMMEFLLTGRPPTVDIENGRCCLTEGNSRWSTEELKATLGWAQRFFEHWPDHVTAGLDG